jgi:hypothetical protein
VAESEIQENENNGYEHRPISSMPDEYGRYKIAKLTM